MDNNKGKSKKQRRSKQALRYQELRNLEKTVNFGLYSISGEKEILLDLYKTELTIVELEEELKKCYESDLHEKELLLENLKKFYKQDLAKISLLENLKKHYESWLYEKHIVDAIRKIQKMRTRKVNVNSMLYDISGEKKILSDLHKKDLTIVKLKKFYKSDWHKKCFKLEEIRKSLLPDFTFNDIELAVLEELEKAYESYLYEHAKEVIAELKKEYN